MTMPLLLILALFAAPVPGRAQVVDTEWAAYTSMSEVQDIHVQDLHVWAATSGGVLDFDRGAQAYRRYTGLDGLGGNGIFAVTADSSGALWFGTDGFGLSRLDPVTGTFDAPILDFRDLRITALLADGPRLYVGTDRGVSVYLLDKREVKESYRRLGNLPKDTEVTALAIADGVLFATTRDGLAWARLDQANLQDPDSWRSMSIAGAGNDVVATDDGVFAGAFVGIYRYDPAADTFHRDFAGEPVTALGATSNGVIAGTESGRILRRIERSDWRPISPLTYPRPRALSRSDLPYVLVGTDDGLKAVGPGAPTLPTSGEPGSSRFYEIALVDDEVWATSVPDDQQRTLSAGAYQLVDGAWRVYDKTGVLPNDEPVALEVDAEGRLWIGTWGGGALVRDADGSWTPVSSRNSALRGLSNNADFVVIGDIRRDADGHLWFVNNLNGIAVLDGFPAEQELLIDQVELGVGANVDFYRMAIGPDGLKWIASRTHGLVMLDDGGTPFVPGDDRYLVIDADAEPRMSSNRLFAVYVGDDGRVWMAADNGLNVLTPDYDRDSGILRHVDWRTYTTFDGLLSSEINALEGDDAGNVWVGTENGLTRIGADGLVDFTLTQSNSGLIDNRVKGLTFDSDTGELWIGTFDGLNRLRLVAGDDDGPGVEGFAVYPNPFVTAGRAELTFTGLPLGASVRIFSMAGDAVARLTADPGRGTVTWNGLNDAGFLVASGIYLYVAEGEAGDRVRGRFAVVNGRP